MSWDKLKVGQYFIDGFGSVCTKTSRHRYNSLEKDGSVLDLRRMGGTKFDFYGYYNLVSSFAKTNLSSAKIKCYDITKTVLLLCSTDVQDEEILCIYNKREDAERAREALKMVIKDRHIAVLDIEVK